MAAANRTVWQTTVDTDVKIAFEQMCKEGGIRPSTLINMLMKAFIEDRLEIGEENDE